jgi:hypothetical protein
MMKHVSSSRRGRNRGNGKRHPLSRSNTFESNGPDGKIRGSAQQVLDKYLALGRDATTSGDPVAAEGYYQFAEHYYRVLHANDGSGGDRGQQDRARRFPVTAEARPEGVVVDAGSAEQPATGATIEAATGADRRPN